MRSRFQLAKAVSFLVALFGFQQSVLPQTYLYEARLLPKNFYGAGISQAGDVSGFRIVDLNGVNTYVAALAKSNGEFIEDLGSLDDQCKAVDAFGVIHNPLSVVGSSWVGNCTTGSPMPYLWTDGRMFPLGVFPGGSYGEAYAINRDGTIVGWADGCPQEEDCYLRAFIKRGLEGEMLNLGVLERDGASKAVSINNLEEVVGVSQAHGGNRQRGFVWRKGTMYELPSLPECYLTEPQTINDSGLIIGNCFNYATHTFKGLMWQLPRDGVPFLVESDESFYFTGLNNSGEILANMNQFPHTKQLRRHGRIFDIASLAKLPQSASIVRVRGINDSGAILVDLYDFNPLSAVLTPIKPPHPFPNPRAEICPAIANP